MIHVARELVSIAELLVADEQSTLFEAYFQKARDQCKTIKERAREQGQPYLQNALAQDMAAKGVPVQSLKLSLGKYKGSSFVTSCKMEVRADNEEVAEQLAAYLRKKYSPKFKLKAYDPETGLAAYNVR